MRDEVKLTVDTLRYCEESGARCGECPSGVNENGVPNCHSQAHIADLIESLAAELEQVKRERDAAIADMERLQGLICQVCKEYYQPDLEIREYSCKIYGEYFGEIAEDGLLCCSKFKWRGLQE